jgi:hypothetical protein
MSMELPGIARRVMAQAVFPQAKAGIKSRDAPAVSPASGDKRAPKTTEIKQKPGQ